MANLEHGSFDRLRAGLSPPVRLRTRTFANPLFPSAPPSVGRRPPPSPHLRSLLRPLPLPIYKSPTHLRLIWHLELAERSWAMSVVGGGCASGPHGGLSSPVDGLTVDKGSRVWAWRRTRLGRRGRDSAGAWRRKRTGSRGTERRGSPALPPSQLQLSPTAQLRPSRQQTGAPRGRITQQTPTAELPEASCAQGSIHSLVFFADCFITSGTKITKAAELLTEFTTC
jgi:hypothetical protein